MYDEATRTRALELVESGMNYQDASRELGGKPSSGTIRKWCLNQLPTGKRCKRMVYTQQQKLDALARLDAGEDYIGVAADLGCAPPTLLNWRRLRQERGDDALITAVDRMAL